MYNKFIILFILYASALYAADRYPLLITAAIAGNFSAVKEMVSRGANADTTDKNGSMAMHHAAENGHTEIVEYFIKEQGMHPDTRGALNRTALHWAVKQRHCATIACLINNGATVNIQNKWGITPLYSACASGEERTVELLLAHGADPKIRTNRGDAPFDAACAYGHMSIVRLLLMQHDLVHDVCPSGYCDPKDRNPIDDGWTALHVAASHGQGKIIRFLLAHGADVNARTVDGWTPLHSACSWGELKAARALLKSGRYMPANVDAKTDDGATPLHIACHSDHRDLVEILLQYDADVHAQVKNGRTPLHYATERGAPRIVAALLAKGASVDATDYFGDTPLRKAVSLGSDCTGTVIIKVAKARLYNGYEAYDPTRCADFLEVMRLLVLHGADVNARYAGGWTPMSEASKHGNPDVAQFLITHGANLDIRIDSGLTLIGLAGFCGQTEIVSMLLAYGAQADLNDLRWATAIGCNLTIIELLLKQRILPALNAAQPEESRISNIFASISGRSIVPLSEQERNCLRALLKSAPIEPGDYRYDLLQAGMPSSSSSLSNRQPIRRKYKVE